MNHWTEFSNRFWADFQHIRFHKGRLDRKRTEYSLYTNEMRLTPPKLLLIRTEIPWSYKRIRGMDEISTSRYNIHAPGSVGDVRHLKQQANTPKLCHNFKWDWWKADQVSRRALVDFNHVEGKFPWSSVNIRKLYKFPPDNLESTWDAARLCSTT